jgi:hypothetical protein
MFSYSQILTSKSLSLVTSSIGLFELALSVIYDSTNLAFMGLGLFFFGIVLGYIRTEIYVKKVILDATVLSQMMTLNEVLNELDYVGQPVYLSPRYFNDPDAQKVYVPKKKETKLPTPEEMQDPTFFLKNAAGILLTPTCYELTRLFEKKLQKKLIEVDLEHLQKTLPKLFVDLEIAKNLTIEKREDSIVVTMDNCRFSMPMQSKSDSGKPQIQDSPLCSAIACSLAKVTGRCLIKAAETTDSTKRNVVIEYRIVDNLNLQN